MAAPNLGPPLQGGAGLAVDKPIPHSEHGHYLYPHGISGFSRVTEPRWIAASGRFFRSEFGDSRIMQKTKIVLAIASAFALGITYLTSTPYLTGGQIWLTY